MISRHDFYHICIESFPIIRKSAKKITSKCYKSISLSCYLCIFFLSVIVRPTFNLNFNSFFIISSTNKFKLKISALMNTNWCVSVWLSLKIIMKITRVLWFFEDEHLWMHLNVGIHVTTWRPFDRFFCWVMNKFCWIIAAVCIDRGLKWAVRC